MCAQQDRHLPKAVFFSLWSCLPWWRGWPPPKRVRI